MAFTGSISAFSNQTTPDLQRWGQGISQGFVAAGLVNTNAVGSINWPSVSSASGSAAVYGFDVFRFDDSLQATAPVFIKLEYRNRGAAPPNAQAPSVVLTIGTTHNGAGTIGGQMITPASLTFQYTGGSSDIIVRNNLFAGGDGWFNAALWYDEPAAATGQWFINLERTRDVAGNPTADGLCWNFLGTENGSSPRSGYMPFVGNIPASQVRIGVLTSPAGVLAVTNNLVMPGRIFHFDGGTLPFPITSLLYTPPPMFFPYRVFTYSPYVGMLAQYVKFPTNTLLSSDGGFSGRIAMRIS